MSSQTAMDLIAAGRATGGEAVCLVDREGRIVAADAIAGAWAVGVGPDATWLGEVIGAAAAEAVARIIEGASEIAFDAPLNVGDAADARVHVRMRRLDGDRGPMALVTFQRNAEVAVVDALTGLPDRRGIAGRVAQWRGDCGGSPAPFALLFLDLDGFKRINDEHGHAAGDEVLATVAWRLARCVRDEDLVARYGGDEFVLLLKDVATVGDAEPVMERLRECTRQAVELGELRLHLGATIGVAIADGAVQSLEELIAAADRDMYARKRRLPK